MSPELICLIAGPIITIIVSGLKWMTLVANHPKVIAFLLSTITGLVSIFAIGDMSFDWRSVVTCIITPFALSVATYEVVKSSPVTSGS